MGNCYEDTRPAGGEHTGEIPLQDQREHFIYNSTIISELRALPAIAKPILNRMEELGPFLADGSTNFGPIYQLKNKSVYQGHQKNKLFHGPGRLILANGIVIQSQFDNGEPKKKTRIFKPNGDYFSGTIEPDGTRQNGTVHQKGITYQGQLRNQKPHGYGRQYTKNYKFSGTYQNGRKKNGLLEWNIDNQNHVQSYQGAFVNNMFNGIGTLINSDGKFIGNFENGGKNGYGQFTYPSGQVFKGNFKKNKPEGAGKVYFNDKLIQQGIWLNGKKVQNQTNY